MWRKLLGLVQSAGNFCILNYSRYWQYVRCFNVAYKAPSTECFRAGYQFRFNLIKGKNLTIQSAEKFLRNRSLDTSKLQQNFQLSHSLQKIPYLNTQIITVLNYGSFHYFQLSNLCTVMICPKDKVIDKAKQEVTHNLCQWVNNSCWDRYSRVIKWSTPAQHRDKIKVKLNTDNLPTPCKYYALCTTFTCKLTCWGLNSSYRFLLRWAKHLYANRRKPKAAFHRTMAAFFACAGIRK